MEDDVEHEVILFVVVALYFLLRAALFGALSFTGVSPGLLVVTMSSFNFVHNGGRKL